MINTNHERGDISTDHVDVKRIKTKPLEYISAQYFDYLDEMGNKIIDCVAKAHMRINT